ncbi:10589_t:CDS:2 [Paraglomus occultum]|uniref:10589_t:CDS:1 n=1 Tax=Paraglomus occultum TaxID=144539 RepID=A0A9N9CWW2_9GLOM|nr:10589_t:CDS:2 [Paraglomus occultum]
MFTNRQVQQRKLIKQPVTESDENVTDVRHLAKESVQAPLSHRTTVLSRLRRPALGDVSNTSTSVSKQATISDDKSKLALVKEVGPVVSKTVKHVHRQAVRRRVVSGIPVPSESQPLTRADDLVAPKHAPLKELSANNVTSVNKETVSANVGVFQKTIASSTISSIIQHKQQARSLSRKRAAAALQNTVQLPDPVTDISNSIDTNSLKQHVHEAEAYEAELDRLRAKKAKVQRWDDLDADDFNDPFMVSEYVVEIFDYLRELEKQTMPNSNYMENQKELGWKMRTILVDWLVEIHSNFRLLPETLYLAVNIVDRFLSLRVVSLVKLQLVGITAMFIASKYEEVVAPSVKNFVYMADGGYSDKEILKAERYVLQVLDFRLCYPNPMNFLRRVSKADGYDISTRTIAKYLMEISLFDNRFLGTAPSMAAAAALYLARKMLNRGEWNNNLVHYSYYTEEELRPVVDLMVDFLRRPRKSDAFERKYAAKKFLKASLFAREWVKHSVGLIGNS